MIDPMSTSTLDVDVTIKNYRRFARAAPARFELRDGLTAFLGANNAGKSSLLRFFYEFRPLFRALQNWEGMSNALNGKPTRFEKATSLFDPREVFSHDSTAPLDIEFRFRSYGEHEPAVEGATHTIESILLTIEQRTPNDVMARFVAPNGNVIPFATNMNFHHDFSTISAYNIDPETGYIYVGHVLEFLRNLSDALYIGPFRNIITVGSNEDYFDIAVGEAFVRQWRQYKTGNSKTEQEAALKVESDIGKIFDIDGFDVHASADNQTLQFKVNDHIYKHTETGTGLAQFILVLANAAIRKPPLILIDEPEMNLHPRLQLDFLTTLASYSGSGTVIFSTHSTGLARSSADRIYTVTADSRLSSKIAPYERTARMSEFLGELNFSAWQDVGFDQLLLVEGVSEVKTIQQFLRMGSKEHRVLLMPLGGSQFINDQSEDELRELLRITGSVSAVVDSERVSAGAELDRAHKGFVAVCERLGIDCHVLEWRATENYLADHAVKAVKGHKYRALAPFESRGELSPIWSKNENWQIARAMRSTDIEDTDLGRFLAAL